MSNWVAHYLEAHEGVTITRRDRNALHFRGREGTGVALCHAAPIHYLEGREWLPLDTDLTWNARHNRWQVPGVAVGLREDGTVSGPGIAHHSGRVGLLNPATGCFRPLFSLPPGRQHGDSLRADMGVYRHTLRVIPLGIEEELVLLERPELPAGTGDWLALETMMAECSGPDGWADDEWTQGTLHFPPPVAWDAHGRLAPCRRYHRDGRIYTGVPVEWLAAALYPVTIDPDVVDLGGMAADASQRRWTEVIGTSSAYVDTSDPYHITGAHVIATAILTSSSGGLMIGQDAVGATNPYDVLRVCAAFDTRSLGAGSRVTNVTMTVVPSWVSIDPHEDPRHFTLKIMKYDWVAIAPISTANMQIAFDGALAAEPDDDDFGSTEFMVYATPVTSGSLDSGWVNVDDWTLYALVSSDDIAGLAPELGDTQNVTLGYPYSADAARRPYLTVTYLTAAEAGGSGITRGRRVPEFTVNLFQRDFGGSLLVPDLKFRAELMSWTALGGCDLATIRATGREGALWDLADMLRCPVEIIDQDGVAVWWGYVNSAGIDFGRLSFGVNLDSMANKVAVAYAYQGSGVAGVSGRATTDWAEHADSVTEYGSFERLESLSDAGSVEAEARRDALLEALHWPVPEIDFTGRGLSGTLQCRGWWHALKRRYYANDGTTDAATTDQIEAIITDVGSEFFRDTAIETASGVDTNEYRDGDSNAWQIIEDLLTSGVNTEEARLLAQVTRDRVLRVYQEPDPGLTDARLYSDGDLSDSFGTPVRIGPDLVGRHARLMDAIPPYVNLSRVADPTRVFIERAEYDVERVRLRPQPRGNSIYRVSRVETG